jgi:hypothetical protein
MFGSMWFLTKDIRASAIAMAIPLILGWLNLLPSLGYALTALAVVAALGAMTLPDRVRSEVERAILAASRVQQPASTVPAGPH